MNVQVAFQEQSSAAVALRRGAEVIRAEADALKLMADGLDNSFFDACKTMLAAPGRVVVTGMGKSGHIARKWAATLAATGTPSIYVHPAEAAHGDLGMLISGDVLVVISNSGNTGELRPFLRYATQQGVPIIGVASKLDSLVMREAAVRLCYPAVREACLANVAPTTSTTLQLALGDALAMALMDMRGFSVEGMKLLHPGGVLGLRLTPVGDLMHREALPVVSEDAEMSEVLGVMTSGGFGIAGVVDVAGRLIGVITDGDLRRHFDQLSSSSAGAVMSCSPKIATADMRAEEVLEFLNANQITAAFVVDRFAPVNHNVPIGVVHLHDFLRVGLS